MWCKTCVKVIYQLNNLRLTKGVFVAREAQLKVRNKKLVYLEPLTKLPPFEVWIPIVVVETIANPKKVSKKVTLTNISPLDYTIKYHSMYALGNHLQVVNVK